MSHVVSGVRRCGLNLSIGPNGVDIVLKNGDSSVSETLFQSKIETVYNLGTLITV
jgi:hypothetical protein